MTDIDPRNPDDLALWTTVDCACGQTRKPVDNLARAGGTSSLIDIKLLQVLELRARDLKTLVDALISANELISARLDSLETEFARMHIRFVAQDKRS